MYWKQISRLGLISNKTSKNAQCTETNIKSLDKMSLIFGLMCELRESSGTYCLKAGFNEKNGLSSLIFGNKIFLCSLGTDIMQIEEI